MPSKLTNLRVAFDNYLLKEITVFGGVPVRGGRLGKEMQDWIEATADFLDTAPEVDMSKLRLDISYPKATTTLKAMKHRSEIGAALGMIWYEELDAALLEDAKRLIENSIAVGKQMSAEETAALIRHQEQALQISAILMEAGVGPVTLPEGVRILAARSQRLGETP